MDGDDEDRFQARRNQYKKAVTAADARRKRAEHTVKLRQDKKEEHATKRRHAISEQEEAEALGPAVAAVSRQLVPTPDMLPRCAALVTSANEKEQLEGAAAFRRLLSMERHPPVDYIISLGVVPYFVSFLTRDANTALQFEAAWALTNIASGTSEHTRTVMAAGAVPAFVHLLASPMEDVREQAVWALGNIAGDSTYCRDQVLAADALPGLLANMRHEAKTSFVRNCVWTLSNLCRGKPLPEFRRVAPALPMLAKLIYSTDNEILADSLWALSYLSDGNADVVQVVVEAGVVTRVVELLSHADYTIHTPALRTVGNIVTGDEIQTQLVINAGALPALCRMLIGGKRGLQKEACWAISNIMAGTREQIDSIIGANIIAVLVDKMKRAPPEIQKEAVWSISNATTSATPAHVDQFVRLGVLVELIAMVETYHVDARIVMVGMEGIENILIAGTALYGDNNPYIDIAIHANVSSALEVIQEYWEDTYIVNKAASILRTYFGGFDADEEGLLPPVPVPVGAQQQFLPFGATAGMMQQPAPFGAPAGGVLAPMPMPAPVGGWGGVAHAGAEPQAGVPGALAAQPPHAFNFASFGNQQ